MIPSSVPRTKSTILRISAESGTCWSIWMQASNTDVCPWNNRR